LLLKLLDIFDAEFDFDLDGAHTASIRLGSLGDNKSFS
jgi:hypothetical protein